MPKDKRNRYRAACVSNSTSLLITPSVALQRSFLTNSSVNSRTQGNAKHLNLIRRSYRDVGDPTRTTRISQDLSEGQAVFRISQTFNSNSGLLLVNWTELRDLIIRVCRPQQP